MTPTQSICFIVFLILVGILFHVYAERGEK